MRKVTSKIILIAFIIMFIASLFPRILFSLYNVNHYSSEIDIKLLYIAGFLSVFTAIGLFTFFLNNFILKRIKELNIATRKVIQGNYDFTLKMKDKDEISELTNNFNRMVKELQSNEYLSKEFIRNITHELKTPLSAIHGYAELIHTANLSPEEIKEYSGIIASESKRLSLLSKDILQISLIEYQTIDHQDEPFNIAEQIRNVLQLMQLNWESKAIEFDLDLEEIESTNNKEITYQIWTNLISNAIKYSQEGALIKIQLKASKDHINFSISNPAYISEADQEKVFNLFFIANKSDNRDSNGIGLTLTAKIVEKLNGEIELTSNDGQVCVKISLPKSID